MVNIRHKADLNILNMVRGGYKGGNIKRYRGFNIPTLKWKKEEKEREREKGIDDLT